MTDNLEGLRAALKRGTKRSRLRLAVLVCTAGHALIEIFRGDDGTSVGVYRYEAGTGSDAHLFGRGRAFSKYTFTPEKFPDCISTQCRCRNPSGLVKSRTLWQIPADAISTLEVSGRVVAIESWRSVFEGDAGGLPARIVEEVPNIGTLIGRDGIAAANDAWRFLKGDSDFHDFGSVEELMAHFSLDQTGQSVADGDKLTQ